MKKTHEESSQRHPLRRRRGIAEMLAGLCMGFGIYGMIHSLMVEESAFRLILSSVTLCCGLVLLLRTRHTAPRDEEENENR